MLKAKKLRPMLQRHQQLRKNSGQGVETLQRGRSHSLLNYSYFTNANTAKTPEVLTLELRGGFGEAKDVPLE